MPALWGRSRTVGNHSVMAALVCVRTSQGTRKLWKCFHTPSFFPSCPFSFSPSFFHFISFLKSFLSSTYHNQLWSSSPHNTKLHLHLSGSTPLRKTLTVNYYLRIEYFQHARAHRWSDAWAIKSFLTAVFSFLPAFFSLYSFFRYTTFLKTFINSSQSIMAFISG